jgi:hypothetical protein
LKFRKEFKLKKICRLNFLGVLGECKNDNCVKCSWYEPEKEVKELKNKIYSYKIKKN